MSALAMKWRARFNALLSAGWRTKALVVFALALALRVGLALVWYTGDLRHFQSGDYALYYIGAEHFRDYRDFTNSLFLVRPPLFPLLVYVLGLNGTAVLFVNALTGACIAPLSCVLARQLGIAERFALLAGLVVALSPGNVVYSTFLGPEPLANLLLLLSVIVLLAAARMAARWRSLTIGGAAGVALALSTLARPAAFLVGVPLGCVVVLVRRRWWLAVAGYCVLSLAGAGIWTVHNGRTFGNYTVTSEAAYTMLYYRAVSVERLATGKAVNDIYTEFSTRVEARLGRDTTGIDEGTRHGHLAAPQDVQDAIFAEAIAVFRAHPLEYIATIPQGLIRMYVLTDPLPTALKLVDAAWNVVFVLGTALGLYGAARRRRWLLFGIVVMLGLYYTVGTLAVKVSAVDTRMTSMLTPFMAAAFVYAVQLLAGRRRARRLAELNATGASL